MNTLGERITYEQYKPKRITVEGIVIRCETEPGLVMHRDDEEFHSIKLTILQSDGTKFTTPFFADLRRPIRPEQS